MILVMLGTNPYPFRRLLDAIDLWASRTGGDIIAQTGHTPTEGIRVKCADFVSHEQIMDWVSAAELVICQGGFGSMRDALSAGKAVIAVPRDPELGECIDSQREIVETLAEEKRIIPLYRITELDAAIRTAKQFGAPTVTESGLPDQVAKIIADMRTKG